MVFTSGARAVGEANSAGGSSGQAAEADCSVEVLQRSEDRERFEVECQRAGVKLPVSYRLAWDGLVPSEGQWLVAVRSPTGLPAAALMARAHGTRAVPGHRVLRVERFGMTGDDAAVSAAVAALARVARLHSRILRVHLELFSPSEDRRALIGRAAARVGFQRQYACRMYERTVAIDLAPSEDRIFRSLHPTARRHIRSLTKHPVMVAPIAELQCAARLDELERETLARTGGKSAQPNWRRIIAFAREQPGLARLVGLFRTDRTDDSTLVAFALGLNHGTEVEYCLAGSARPADLRIPMGYGLAWDLIQWGKGLGASWFDFGGIVAEHPNGAVHRGDGVSQFKRYFTHTEISVGEEWVLVIAPVRSAVATYVARAADWVRRVRH